MAAEVAVDDGAVLGADGWALATEDRSANAASKRSRMKTQMVEVRSEEGGQKSPCHTTENILGVVRMFVNPMRTYVRLMVKLTNGKDISSF